MRTPPARPLRGRRSRCPPRRRAAAPAAPGGSRLGVQRRLHVAVTRHHGEVAGDGGPGVAGGARAVSPGGNQARGFRLCGPVLGALGGKAGTDRRNAATASSHLNRLQYCLGDMIVGSLPAPPSMPVDLTHVSSCLSHVYCLRVGVPPGSGACRASRAPCTRVTGCPPPRPRGCAPPPSPHLMKSMIATTRVLVVRSTPTSRE